MNFQKQEFLKVLNPFLSNILDNFQDVFIKLTSSFEKANDTNFLILRFLRHMSKVFLIAFVAMHILYFFDNLENELNILGLYLIFFLIV